MFISSNENGLVNYIYDLQNNMNIEINIYWEKKQIKVEPC